MKIKISTIFRKLAGSFDAKNIVFIEGLKSGGGRIIYKGDNADLDDDLSYTTATEPFYKEVMKDLNKSSFIKTNVLGGYLNKDSIQDIDPKGDNGKPAAIVNKSIIPLSIEAYNELSSKFNKEPLKEKELPDWMRLANYIRKLVLSFNIDGVQYVSPTSQGGIVRFQGDKQVHFHTRATKSLFSDLIEDIKQKDTFIEGQPGKVLFNIKQIARVKKDEKKEGATLVFKGSDVTLKVNEDTYRDILKVLPEKIEKS